ncbi:MAG: hypothetical protein AABW86_04795 [Candidatus Micrarchaeota archaeon]
MTVKHRIIAGTVLFLGASIGTVSMVGNPFSKGRQDPVLEELPAQNPKGKIYGDGDVIKTPIGDIKIMGWKLAFDLDKDGCSDQHHKRMERYQFTLFRDDKDLGRADWCTLLIVYDPDFHIQLDMERPDNPAYLRVEHIQDYLVLDQNTYQIKPTVFVYDGFATSGLRIYSDHCLTSSTLSGANATYWAFENFGATEPPIVVHDYAESGHYAPTTIVLPSKELISTRTIYDGTEYLTHELGHGLYRTLDHSVDLFPYQAQCWPPKAIESIHMAYSSLRNAFKLEKPWLILRDQLTYQFTFTVFTIFSPDFIRPYAFEYSTYFAMFDESNYMTKGVRLGHPYTHPTELFASALTVFRFYPREFIARYELLSDEIRGVVREAALFILDALEVADNGRGKVSILIPEYELLKVVLEAGQPKASYFMLDCPFSSQ